MSIKEFTKAAKIYDSGKSGIYEMCKYDYPKVLKELKNKKFNDVLDCGCGIALGGEDLQRTAQNFFMRLLKAPSGSHMISSSETG